MKKMIFFDLDGTLARSKSKIEKIMVSKLENLTKKYDIAIISGGDYPQFEKQVTSQFEDLNCFSNLHLLPTSGSKYYKFENDSWQCVYIDEIPKIDREKIITAMLNLKNEYDFLKVETWGPQIEDRLTQITFSALGQEAPVEEKEKWDQTKEKRILLKNHLEKLIPDYEVRTGGSTSIDVTKKGIDKGFGIKKMNQMYNIDFSEMVYIGDALHEGGNDYAAVLLGVDNIPVSGPLETLEKIDELISN